MQNKCIPLLTTLEAANSQSVHRPTTLPFITFGVRLKYARNLFKTLPDKVPRKAFQEVCTCTESDDHRASRKRFVNPSASRTQRVCTVVSSKLPKDLQNAADVTLKYYFNEALFVTESSLGIEVTRTEFDRTPSSSGGHRHMWAHFD